MATVTFRKNGKTAYCAICGKMVETGTDCAFVTSAQVSLTLPATHYNVKHIAGDALYSRCDRDDYSTVSTVVTAEITAKNDDILPAIVALRSTVWSVTVGKFGKTVFTANVTARRNKVITTLCRELASYTVKWETDGIAQINADNVNEYVKAKSRGNNHGKADEITRLSADEKPIPCKPKKSRKKRSDNGTVGA